jgi:uncharacterized protein (TIGR02453 family)
MPIIQPAYFQFFSELSMNNHRDWFHANKKRYENDVKAPFIQVLTEIVEKLADSEPDLGLVPVKQMLFRINRDIRFSKDKRPYKEHFSGSISRFGTRDKIYPGHYLEIGLERTFIAGGAYFFEEKETLYRVRRYISENLETFDALLSNPNFVEKFGSMAGEKNKRLPAEFAQHVEKQPLIANTQFYWSAILDPESALSDNFTDTLKTYLEAAQPLNQFLVEAIYS